MAENTKPAVEIGQMNIRIPGRGADAGNRIAGGIADGLARKLSHGAHHRIGALSIQLEHSGSASEAELIDAIVDRIRGSLRKRKTMPGHKGAR